MSETELDSDKDPYGHPRIPLRGLYDVNSCNLRRQWAEKFANCTLDQVGAWWPNQGSDDACSCLNLKGNIENPIGLAKVPVGLVGPLLVRGKNVAGYVLCPFATTEGALVASATRGASALMRSGGVFVSTEDHVMTRAPSFTFANAKEAELFWTWLRDKLDDLRLQVRQYSQHAELVSLSPQRFGRTLVVQFKYCTRDAAGQNMVTGATSHLCKWLLGKAEKDMEGVRVVRFLIESNLSCDKKLAMLNLVQTRGVHVQAEAWVPESVLQSVLKVDSTSLLDTYQHFIHSSFRAGTIGFNTNASNIIAAVFIATGQDVASVVESATCQLILAPASKEEIEQAMRNAGVEHPASCGTEEGGGVYACLVMPSLIVGTVGGGTGLATQKECLRLMGCHGTGDVGRLAEIIVGFALALELSTLASVCGGQFASAHEKLGRNRPQNGLKDSHIGPELFTGLMGEGWTFVRHTPFTVSSGNSILTELTRVEMSKMVGHFGFEATYESKETRVQQTVKMVLKAKPTDTETCNMVNKIAQGCGLQLAVNYEKFKMQTGFRNTHSREVELCQLENKAFKQFLPRVYKVLYDRPKEVHAILMEHLDHSNTCLLDCADDITGWRIEDIKVVLRDMASIHALFLDQGVWLSSQEWLERMSSAKMSQMSPLWYELVRHAHQEFPETWTSARAAIVDMAIQHISTIWSILDPLPHTLSHNDFNPRNICLRLAPQQGSSSQSAAGPPAQPSLVVPYPDPRRLCIYDWELACIDVPQHDLAELLAFTLAPSVAKGTVLELVEFYQQHLEYYSGRTFPKESFLMGFNMACLDYAMNRLLLYTMAHTFKDYKFLPRVVNTLFGYIEGELGGRPLEHLFNKHHYSSKL